MASKTYRENLAAAKTAVDTAHAAVTAAAWGDLTGLALKKAAERAARQNLQVVYARVDKARDAALDQIDPATEEN